MQIKTIRAFPGPNIFNNKPVLRMTLDLGDLVDYDSTQLPGLSERLLGLLPGLSEHGCSLGRPGGFVERLRRGTYLAHIVEHVAIELSDPAGIPVTYGKTIASPEARCYYVVVAYTSEQGMRRLLETAVDVVHALLSGKDFPLTDRLAEVKTIVADSELGPSTRAIADAADAQGIPWTRISEGSLLRLGYGRHVKYVQAAVSSETSDIAVDIASDKALAKQLLAEAGLPVPHGTVIKTVEEAPAALNRSSCLSSSSRSTATTGTASPCMSTALRRSLLLSPWRNSQPLRAGRGTIRGGRLPRAGRQRPNGGRESS